MRRSPAVRRLSPVWRAPKRPRTLLLRFVSVPCPFSWRRSVPTWSEREKLGEDAIRTSLIAGAIGLAIVIIFMIIVYALPGICAGIALVIYTLMMLLCLNAFDLTLTLPGIAGIILSIGMASRCERYHLCTYP